MTCAATASRRALRFLCVSPAAHRADSANAVEKRSSAKITGKPVTPPSHAPNARASAAFVPSRPVVCSGSPTTSPPTCSRSTRAVKKAASWSGPCRSRTSSGDAMIRSVSVIAKPTRTVP